MPIRVKCECGRELRVKDELRGKKFKCPACAAVLTAKEIVEEHIQETSRSAEREAEPRADKDRQRRDEAEDVPSRRRRKDRAPKKSSTGLILGLVGGGVLLVMVCCGVGAYLFMRNIPQLVQDNDNNKTLTLVNGTAKVSSRLWASNRDKPALKQPSRRYAVTLEANKFYQIDMTSTSRSLRHGDFDSYLYLEDSQGNTLAEDDDGGIGLNARITFACAKAGNYAIVATTLRDELFGGGTETGAFDLTVTEVGAGNNPPGQGPPGQGQANLVLNDSGQLQSNSPVDPVRKTPCKIYPIAMKVGKTYQIDMLSTTFDTYLRLVGPDGKQLAEDDDGGQGTNARIRYQCTQAGECRIYATCLIRRVGSFRLEVREEYSTRI